MAAEIPKKNCFPEKRVAKNGSKTDSRQTYVVTSAFNLQHNRGILVYWWGFVVEKSSGGLMVRAHICCLCHNRPKQSLSTHLVHQRRPFYPV